MNEGDAGRANYSKTDCVQHSSRKYKYIYVNGTLLSIHCAECSPEYKYVYFNIVHDSKKSKIQMQLFINRKSNGILLELLK